jgi:hypothetical protein
MVWFKKSLLLSIRKTVWVLNIKKKLDGIKSFKVLKLKVVNNKISPKKKKKHQKKKRRYIVDLDVNKVN